jgi:hypothetical protein
MAITEIDQHLLLIQALSASCREVYEYKCILPPVSLKKETPMLMKTRDLFSSILRMP